MQVVREMTVADLAQVMVIENENFSKPWTDKGFLSFLLRYDTLFLVAEEEEQIIGFAGVVMVLDEAELTNVAVLKSRQKEGIGRLLIESLIRLIAECGVEILHLEVRVSNSKAISLYQRMDFEEVGLRYDYYEAPKEDAILMRRKISIK